MFKMKNCRYIDNIGWIDWNEIISNLSNGCNITTDPTIWEMEGEKQIYYMWKQANFNDSSIGWTNFYPGDSFPTTVVDVLSDCLKVTPIRCWISKIEPGYICPWHWDVDFREQDFLKKFKNLKSDNLVRYSCFIGNPHMGHIFILGNDYLFNQKQGSMYKWNDYKEWHSGINAGLNPKYMFHLTGHLNI